MIKVQQTVFDRLYAEGLASGLLAECSRAVVEGRGWKSAAYYLVTVVR